MNNANLIGRLVKDIELKYTSNNKAFANFTLAVNRKFTKQGEEKQADFISCQAWDKVAELLSKYTSKGSNLAVEGRIQTRTWDDNDGKKHYVTEVIVEDITFVEPKKVGEGQAVATGQTIATGPDIGWTSSEELPF